MIWHIFEKDWKLLWPIACGATAVHAVFVAVVFRLGLFGENRTFGPLLTLIQMAAYFCTAFLIVSVVHQDGLPGVRQDWLVRPIQRRHLLAAKLLFVLLVANGPIFLLDLAEALGDGFSLERALLAALSRCLYLIIGFSVPFLAFASLTSTFMEAVAGGLALFMTVMVFEGASSSLSGVPFDLTRNTGLSWVVEAGRFWIILLGCGGILALQYFRRKTPAGRGVLVGVTLLCLMLQFFPWQSAFAIQQHLSANPGSEKRLSLSFAPELGIFRHLGGLDQSGDFGRYRRLEGDTDVYLPLRVEGLPADAVLKMDRSQVRLVEPDGKTHNLWQTSSPDVWNDGAGMTSHHIYQGIRLRGDLYHRLKGTPVRLQIDYSLTLLRLDESHALAALGGEQRLAGVGWCAAKVNSAETAVMVHCLQPGVAPSCASVFLEHAPSGRRNPSGYACPADYTPYFGRYLADDAISRIGFNAPFRDPSGLARYPVDGSMLRDSRVVFRIYRPWDHFSRHLVISRFRLEDWVPGGAGVE